MTTEIRDILTSAKNRIRDEIIVIEQTLGVVDARTVTLPLVAAFDAINRLLKGSAK